VTFVISPGPPLPLTVRACGRLSRPMNGSIAARVVATLNGYSGLSIRMKCGMDSWLRLSATTRNSDDDNETRKEHSELSCFVKIYGARRGTRTPTALRPLGPKPSASANSASRAQTQSDSIIAATACSSSALREIQRLKTSGVRCVAAWFALIPLFAIRVMDDLLRS
jgi:hypothetical protein